MVISRIFKLCLLIQIVHSFRTPKHNSRAYHKTLNNVFLINPQYPTTYGIYLAGETITVDIPFSVVNVSDIFNWKVVNLKRNRLMFVHNNKPYILINQERIKDMEFSGKLNSPIIAFGDNEALHVPTILNPDLTEPVPKWNYIELLHFDDQNEKVSVIRCLPMLKDDDWKFIKKWKMTDYFHHENKLYLLMNRVILEEKAKKDIVEASIIRLCLNKGSELISSAIEVHYAFTDYTGLEMSIVFDFEYVRLTDPHQRMMITKGKPGEDVIHQTGRAENFILKFDMIARRCASGEYESNDVTLLRHHLRSEVGKCTKFSYESCSTKENIVPSTSFDIQVTDDNTFPYTLEEHIVNIETFAIPYPFYERYNFFTSMFDARFTVCRYDKCSHSAPHKQTLKDGIHLHAYLNHKTSSLFYVTKDTNRILNHPFVDPCRNLTSCTKCIMYGLYYGCIWSSNSDCLPDYQTKKITELTVNKCFKISSISPLTFNLTAPTTLTIELDEELPKDSYASLVITAGYNNCTNITMDELYIYCSLNILKSGKFPVDVSLISDMDLFADTATISAVSTDMVDIFVPELLDEDHLLTILMILIFTLLFNSVLVIACFVQKNQRLNKFCI
uniref:Uncharacterized protein n=1 Tax=Tetranychus urticae TaxID=32264 RepID=A0A158P5L0_TETUR